MGNARRQLLKIFIGMEMNGIFVILSESSKNKENDKIQGMFTELQTNKKKQHSNLLV